MIIEHFSIGLSKPKGTRTGIGLKKGRIILRAWSIESMSMQGYPVDFIIRVISSICSAFLDQLNDHSKIRN